jgi:VanZ family protein
MSGTLFSRPHPALKLRFLWLFLGYLLIFVVVYLSITTQPVKFDMGIDYQDKLFHALAYFGLMAWFAQIYHDRFQRNMIAIVFILMGVLLEYLQSLTEVRMFEYADMLANAAGVGLGLLLALTRGRNILVRLEALF